MIVNLMWPFGLFKNQPVLNHEAHIYTNPLIKNIHTKINI